MGRGRRRPREAPHVQPLDVDGVRTVAIMTVVWAIAFVALAFNRERLEEAGYGWLLWTCLAGVGLGLLGVEYTRKRREAIAEAQLEEEAEAELEDDDARPEPPEGDQSEHAGDAPEGPETRIIDTRAGSDTDPGHRLDATDTPSPRTRRRGGAPPDGRSPSTDASGPDVRDASLPGTAPLVAPSPLAPMSPTGPTSPLGPTAPTASTSPTTPTPPSSPTAPTRPIETSPPAQPAPPRRRRQSRGPNRPGRVDVADVGKSLPEDDPLTGDVATPDAPDASISPMWSELIDPPGQRQPSGSEDQSDVPLLDDSTLGGRRARRYDMGEEINEITEGGGGVYRGRRARRRPDSA